LKGEGVRMNCPEPLTKQSLYLWTKTILAEYGIRPLRRLGQNFLIDPRIIEAFMELVPRSDVILEVGPGLGTLSCFLSPRGDRYLAIELDRRLAAIASRLLGSQGNVAIIVGDAVNLIDSVRASIIASNLPYSAASQVLANAVRNNSIHLIVAVVQREIARRLIARPGSREYGRLTVVLSIYFDVSLKAVFPPESFYPKPKVSNALIVLKRKRAWKPSDEGFLQLARCIFTQPRRLLPKVLKACKLPVDAAYRMGFSGVRVRSLSPEDIYALAAEMGELSHETQ
jgi:16S rRNA (adenine1518-N6/adenine1519-N6)-dimethyltransferase